MNELQIFNYNGAEVRTVERNGETWWVAKDVCDVFGETNRNRAMQALDESEKGYTQMTTPGGKQEVSIVNESGLYSMLFAMQPKKARGVSDEYVQNRIEQLKRFRKWVTSEVLPAIRKTGSYTAKPLCIEDVLIQSLQEMKEVKLQIAATNQRVDDIREVVALNPTAWREDARHLISKIATAWGGYEYIKDVQAEIFQLVDARGGVYHIGYQNIS